ncbi:type II secretion system secretin GspD [Celerinatantimonas diazotrophica]|uniref:General secretion pathway protein D n=1 Tax=Celerinatantimonas diazotrophica TaxID=412034 RepID=A0A4R1KDW2_9GAMM|nr:type II secretion system secretin GspD [Celerinatantimonas diazotrophica]TCK62754.1 general secretion pathway protein D [Celerinatantimonas diazotrophica]CAG9298384.1 Secretin GspD [Celerinatantimonas diazotrophica]
MKKGTKALCQALFIGVWLLVSIPVMAADYSANFKQTDITEFINTVGRNLHKTIIIDPSIHGKVNVRSYNMLSEKQYYQFFLNVLQVYGLATVDMPDGVIKVVPAQTAKSAAIPLASAKHPGQGDEMVTRIVPVSNVSVKELTPILRQLSDASGSSNVIHYAPSNVMMITGRAAVVNRMVEIIHQVDQSDDQHVDVVRLKYAAASEIVRVVDSVLSKTDTRDQPSSLVPSVVADERTNSVLISGNPKARARIAHLINQLDSELQSYGNTRVFYLKYAHAKDLVKVLKGVSQTINEQQNKAKGGKSASTSGSDSNFSIEAFDDTNSLVITAKPQTMRSLSKVINQLDIRRAQVHVEAMIVEVADTSGANLGVQWVTPGGGTQFSNGSSVPVSSVAQGIFNARSTTATTYNSNGTSTSTSSSGDVSDLASALSGVQGAIVGFYKGGWGALIQASKTDSRTNVLATPSITTLDNQQASFLVGEEVPIKTGSTTGSDNSNPFTTVERKEVGIKLTVTPQINDGNAVQLKIKQEVSKVNGQTAVDVTFSKRELNTTVLVNNNQTLVLSGLIDNEVEQSVSKVPLLGDIPYLGALFRSKSSEQVKRNLMIFIRPTIVSDSQTAGSLSARKYTAIRALELYRKDQGIMLLPGHEQPVLPTFGTQEQVPQAVQKYMNKMKKSTGAGHSLAPGLTHE